MASKLWLMLPVTAGLTLFFLNATGTCRVGMAPSVRVWAEAIGSGAQPSTPPHAPFTGKKDDVIRFTTLCSTEGNSRLCYHL